MWPVSAGCVWQVPSQDERHSLPHSKSEEANRGCDTDHREAGYCGDGVWGLQADDDRAHQARGKGQVQSEEGVDDKLSGDK